MLISYIRKVGTGRNGTHRDRAFVKISSWDVMFVYSFTPPLIYIEVKGRINRRTRREDISMLWIDALSRVAKLGLIR